MKGLRRILLLVLLTCVAQATATAQEQASAAQRAETLRLQLVDTISKETELRNRLQEIDEALRPENIQRSIALIGTLRPEELRDQRRAQLEKERASVSELLNSVVAKRARLESAVASAEADAGREAAGVTETQAAQPQTTVAQTRSDTGRAVAASARRSRPAARRKATRARQRRVRRSRS